MHTHLPYGRKDAEQLNKCIKNYNILFPDGIINKNAEEVHSRYGVDSLPWFILTNNNHIVVSEGFRLGDLDNQLKQESQNKSGSGT